MDSLWNFLINKALVATLLALIALGAGSLWRQPAFRHALWLLVLASFLTPGVIPVNLPVPAGWHSPTVSEGFTRAASFGVPPPELKQIAAAEAGNPPERPFPPGEPTPPDAGQELLGWKSTGLAVWAGGSLLYALFAFLSTCRFHRLLEQTRAAPARAQETLRRLATRLQLWHPPELRLSPAAMAPLLWVFGRRACIVLPEKLWTALGGGGRETILLHELAHYRRRDHLARWLEMGVSAIFWWHPAAWLARRKLLEAEEELADAWVLWASPERSGSYCQALLDTVDFLADQPRLQPSLGSGLGAQALKRRLVQIRRGGARRKLSLAGFAAVLALSPVALPVLFSFEDGKKLTPLDGSAEYPFQLPEWYEDASKKLEAAADLFLPEEVSLDQALRSVGQGFGLKFQFAGGALEKASAKVKLPRLRGLPLRVLVKLLLKQVDEKLELRIARSGILITDQPEKHSEPEAAPIRLKLDELRARIERKARGLQDEEAPAGEKAENLLKSCTVSFEFKNKPLADMLSFFRQVTGINMIIDGEVLKSDPRLSIHLKNAPANEALDEVLSRLGLARTYQEGVLLVTSREKAERLRDEEQARERIRREDDQKAKALGQKKITAEFRGEKIRRLFQGMQDSAQSPVYPDLEAWKLEGIIPFATGEKTLEEVAAELDRLGIEAVIEPEAIYLLKK